MTFTTIFQNIIKILVKYWDVFLIKGVSVTLALSVITVFFGAILGALLALMKMSRVKVLRFLVTAFVEVIRGTPILLQLYIGYFIVPLMFPALGNEFVTIIKETSLASTFFVGDLMTSYLIVKGATYLAFESLIIVGVIYFVLTFTLSKLVGVYERRLKQSD